MNISMTGQEKDDLLNRGGCMDRPFNNGDCLIEVAAREDFNTCIINM